MYLHVKLKPRVLTAPNREQIWRDATRGTIFTVGTHGVYRVSLDKNLKDSFVRVINFEKRRKKVERTIVKGKKVSSVISRAHWVAFVYDIPVVLINAMNVRVYQENRTFKFMKNV
jgi:hypothetical protein